MKAKEMADRYRVCKDNDSKVAEVKRLVHDLIKESVVLTETRKVKGDSGLRSILMELNDKWKAFARMFPGEINPLGFQIVMVKIIPATSELIPEWSVVSNS